MNNQAIEVIQELSNQLGVAVDKVYPILMRQVQLEGVTGLLASIGLITVSIVGAKLSYNYFKEDRHYSNDDNFLLEIITPVLVPICILLALIFLSDSITALFNPNWYIINNLLKSLL